jgi:peptidoglycan/LPS O-acetylase OafA/YrhL
VERLPSCIAAKNHPAMLVADAPGASRLNREETAGRRLHWIDALRGYAILLVMFTHLDFFPGASVGVQLFFVTSAIALMFSRSAHRETSVTPFFIRRFFRIAPMFWAAIPAFYFLHLLTGGAAADAAQIASAVTFTHWVKFQWNNAAVPGSWSIACEVIFYLFFSFVAARISSARRAAWLLAITVVVAVGLWPVLLWYAAWTGVSDPHSQHLFAYEAFSSQAPCFALGILVFMSLKEQRLNALAVGVLGIAAVVALCFLPDYAARLFLVWATAFAAIAYALGSGRIKFLVNRPICAVGLISYSAYFWHFFVLEISGWLLPNLNRMENIALVIAATVTLSTFTYLSVERPMMRLGARLSQRIAGAC